MAKNKISQSGIVYSTDPGFNLVEQSPMENGGMAPAKQKLIVRLETKHRAGKAVTLVEGFSGTTAEKDEMGKKLKSFCGTGGSVKDGEILIQGDNRAKVLQWLVKNGYVNSKKI